MEKRPEQIRVSVIIPAHNAEKTIYRAIKSVLDQIIPGTEILVVENGSEDNTYSLVKELASVHPEIRLLQSGKGVSFARNAGLEAAKGEYIMFLDADDYFRKSAGKAIKECIREDNADLCLFGHLAGTEIRSVADTKLPMHYKGEDGVQEALIRFLMDPTRYLQVWAKLFRARIIREHNIRFNTGLTLAEDSDFTLQYLDHCNKVKLSDVILYHYVLDPSSVIRKFTGHKAEEYYRSMVETGKRYTAPPQVKYAYNFYILMHMNIVMVREVFLPDNGLTKHEKYRRMREIQKKKLFAGSVKRVRIKDCFSARMSPILCAKLHLYPLCAAAYKYRVKSNLKREGNGL